MPTTLQTVKQPETTPDRLQTRQSILIVDDDQALAATLSRRLQEQGFETEVVSTGQQGIDRAHQRRFALIVLDVHLPDMDGPTIGEKLGDAADTCGIPVIILSGMARPDIIRRSRAVGCYYLVRKPYDANALMVLIHQAIKESEHWAPPVR
jgi:CheY-like chemotaxis protein